MNASGKSGQCRVKNKQELKRSLLSHTVLSTELSWLFTNSVSFFVLGHCLFSNREGLGTSLQIMGLATIDPHRHKGQTKLYKIPKFGVNKPKSKQDTAI